MPAESYLPASNGNASFSFGPFSRRLLFCLGWILLTSLFFAHPLHAFISYSLSNENASHLVLIPFISCWVLFLERDGVFKALSSDVLVASISFASGTGLAVFAFSAGGSWSALNQLSLYILALMLLWIAGFAFFFGRQAVQNARFPLAFLALTIPIPDFLLEKAIYLLQKGSTEIAALLFDWSGVPVLRDGFVFHLARVNIEVARECSGIRSSLALLILAILVSYFYLDKFWKQAILVAAGLLMMIVKNGVRIVTLTLLASYVDPGFLYGRLHREGGVVFFLLGLLLMAPLLWFLQRGQRKPAAQAAN